jgi:threonine/homoserine/homoserine lactone efflux protein
VIEFLLKGLVLGFSIAAPVGPIGVLCIRRTLAEGRAAGFASGLGAATAEAIYGSVAAFGLTVISNFLRSQEFVLRLVGGVFLCYLGVKTWLAQPAERAATAEGHGLVGSYTSFFF